MASLNSVIQNIYRNNDRLSRIARTYYRRRGNVPVTSRKYMEIPINSDVLEIPLFVLKDFIDIVQGDKDKDVIVAILYSYGQTSSYKSLDSVMKDVLSAPFRQDKRLFKVLVPGSSNIYYATFGAIFDEHFTPLMMMSWELERRVEEEGTNKYYFKKPLLRINPHPCVDKEDALQRFICGRMMATALSSTVYTPYQYRDNHFISPNSSSFDYVKVEIDKCPFIIKGTDAPSISVTNKDLLQVAADHIEELL